MSTHYPHFHDRGEGVAAHIAPLTTDDWKRIQASMRRRVSGVFSSQKMNASLPWRKPAERDLLCLLEVDPLVDSIEMLPHQVMLIIEGKKRRHFPGFRIRSGNRVAIMDAFSSREVRDPARVEFTAILTGIYRQHGLCYSAVPQSEILLEPRFGNARYILRSRGFRPDVETQRRVVEALSADNATTIAGIQERLAPLPYVPETVCAMSLAGMLTLELSAAEPCTMRASLRLRDNV